MLVLTRKVGERVVIDGGIFVTLVQVKKNQARIAFEAPNDVGIFREEILGPLNPPPPDGCGVELGKT